MNEARVTEPRVTGPRAGVVLQGVDPPGVFCGMVEEIESLGFDHLWLTDSSLHARNCYSYLTLAATRSSRLLIGTAVTNPATRHPAISSTVAAARCSRSGSSPAGWPPWRRRSAPSGSCGAGRP